jgi:hypothetical protein
MTVLVADANAHVQRPVSVVKMETMLEECTTEEQVLFCVFFLGKMTRCQCQEMIPVYGGKGDCHLFGPLRNHLGGKHFTDDEEVETGTELAETTVKHFYAAGFEALVKPREKCIIVGGGCVEK